MPYSIEGTHNDTTVLKNKFDIKNQEQLDMAERQLVLLNSAKI